MIAPSSALGGVYIAPGVATRDERGAPDVMRGEETQILGAMKSSGAHSGLFVLPGTHSKWARVEAGCIVGFETFMTGEVFAVLKEHSVLGRMMAPRESGANGGFSLGRGRRRANGAGRSSARDFHDAHVRTFQPDRAEPTRRISLGAAHWRGNSCRRARRQSGTVIGAPALAEHYIGAAQTRVAMTAAPENCATLGQIALLERISGSRE